MIDFRYHLVSLVAVFIALAVGIALGAGPLREGISDTLESEVSQLREERADLRAQVDAAVQRAQVKDEAVDLLASRALPGTLDGTRVAVVVLPGADRNTLDQLESRLSLAGADLVLTAEVDARAQAEDPPADRQELVDRLATLLAVPQPRGGADAAGEPDAAQEATLETVLAAVLTGADDVARPGAWVQAGAELDEAGLLDLTWRDGIGAQVTDRRPADAFVVAGGGLTAETVLEPAGEHTLERRLALIDALAALDAPLVVTGIGAESVPGPGLDPVDPLVTAIREDSDLAELVSTVDNTESAAGQVAAAMALAWELQGQSGQYGVGELAEAAVPVVPPLFEGPGVELPGAGEPDPTEPVPVPDPNDEDQGQDEGSGAEGSDGGTGTGQDEPATTSGP
ncbi:copper transporter [Ornithinimicrobium sp. Y1847]|uniref:copper transporter n=1 Tax=unclassified Ornithinimicrobium TaxID=2615080 RepID=UPI003B68276A